MVITENFNRTAIILVGPLSLLFLECPLGREHGESQRL